MDLRGYAQGARHTGPSDLIQVSIVKSRDMLGSRRRLW